MLAPKAEVGSWVSDAAREKFMAAYERAFALWPQPREEFDIETATATTRVHAYRPHPGGVQPARGSRPQQRVGDLPPPCLVIGPLRHPLTVPLATPALPR